MNILIYFDGENKLDSRGNSLWNIEKCICSAFLNSLINKNNKIKFIMPESSLSNYKLWIKEPDAAIFRGTAISKEKLSFFMNNVEISTIADEELINCFNFETRIDEIYNSDIDEKTDENSFNRIKKLVLKKTGEFKPDIVISYPLELGFLKKIFKEKMFFVTEWSIFSRPPLPKSIYFDPIGSVKESFLNVFAENIKKYQITEKENQNVECFKKEIRDIFLKNLDIANVVKPYKKKYRKLVLCPLVSFAYSEKIFPFPDDHSVIRFIMNHVAPDIGVVFTLHPGPTSVSIYEISYYKEKYPNFIFINETLGISMPSVALFPYVDAMINLISLTGTMALLWDLPIVPLYGHYNDWLKDCDSLDEIETVLSKPITNKNNIIYWYFTHYAVFENRFEDGQFYKRYFENKLENFNKKGITFDFYEQNEDFGQISNFILEKLKNNIKGNNNGTNIRGNKKNIYLFGKIKIGSIVRNKKEIIINFLGVKMLRLSFLQKKLFFCGIPIMRWKNN